MLLVDDSIVRGTTCEQIIQMARDAGANRVYFCSAAPAIRYPNVYGIDMPTRAELIAHGRSEQEVCRLIGADKLIFQDLGDLKKAVSSLNPAIEDFDCSVFDGHYVAGNIDERYLDLLAIMRNDTSRQVDGDIIDLYNEGES